MARKRGMGGVDRYDPNYPGQSPVRLAVGRANNYLKEFTERKAKSHARFSRVPLDSLGKRKEEDPEENPNSPKRKKLPFELKEGTKMSKSFRVIEFNKDRRKIDVLAASSIREGNFPGSTLFGATKKTTESDTQSPDKKWMITPKPALNLE